MRSGDFDLALRTYRAGLAQYPEDAELKAGALEAQENATAELLAAARHDMEIHDAQRLDADLARLRQINPTDERVLDVLNRAAAISRAQAALARAKDLAGRGLAESAERAIEEGLSDDPANSDLLALQGQIRDADLVERNAHVLTLSETRPVTLAFRDANLRMVLEALTNGTGINFVVDKDVRPDLRTTIFLKRAPLDEALKLICETSQLSRKIVDEKTVLIYPNTPEKGKEYQELVLHAFYLSSADAKQAAQLMKSMLKVRDPFVDEKLNLIVVREPADTVRLTDRLLSWLDQAEPEVMLQVEVAEISNTELTNLGIQYPQSITFTPLASSGTTSAGGGSSSSLTLGDLANLNRNRIGVSTPAITINLGREVGDANILADPKIRVRNREKAKILIGDKLPVITSTATSTGFVSESVQYIDVGLKLDVEPTIFLDNQVAIKVALEVSSLSGTVTTASGTTAYQISTRNADTLLQLRDGETEILAGLINKNDQITSSRIPGLGDVPVLGRLFSTQNNNGQRTQVVLSITPHVLRNIHRPAPRDLELLSGTETNLRLPEMHSGAPTASIAGTPQPGIADARAEISNGVPAINGAGAAAIADSQAHLKLLASNSPSVGRDFVVSIELSTQQPLRGLPVIVSYDKDRLQFVDAENGPFFAQGGANVSFSKSTDPNTGTAQIGILRSTADGAQGSGVMAQLKFRPLKAGEASIAISKATPVGLGRIVTSDVGTPLRVVIPDGPSK